MTILLILLVFFTLASPIISILLLKRLIERERVSIQNQMESTVRAFVSPKPDGSMSDLANLLDTGGAVIGAAAARSIRTSFAQAEGAVANVATGQADLLVAQQNPLMALLAGGRRGKGAAVQRLAELLMPMLQGASSRASSGNGEHKQGQFLL